MNEQAVKNGKKRCQRCNRWLKLTKFRVRNGRLCGRTKRCKDCADGIHLQRRLAIKQEFVAAYGGKCACCGEHRLGFLTLDHVGGGGKLHRATKMIGAGIGMYKWLKRNNWPKKKFQVLCMNCNWAISYGRPCPHKALEYRRYIKYKLSFV